MTKALIICAAGMSSSLMAKKTTEYLQGQGQDITVEAIGATEGNKVIESATFDLYLISPQECISNNLLTSEKKLDVQLFKFHLKPMFQSQQESQLWLK